MDLLKKSNKIKSLPVDSADRTEIQTLVSRKDGAPNFELRKFKIMPGGNIPEHYHSDIEHEQYVLKGGYTNVCDTVCAAGCSLQRSDCRLLRGMAEG